MAISKGTRLGPYEITGAIGAGGMGEVYRANDTRLDRAVAIKILPEHLAEKAEARERFEREAKTISALNHPHICTLHDIGEEEGLHYIVMEYVEGETVTSRLERGALPLPEVLEYACQIADALDKAHRQGIVHRDLKPSNVMLTASGAKLLDFGLAKLRGDRDTAVSQMATQSQDLTAEGTILGTLQYMAPEQLEAKEADARTDIFAFGAFVYEMATGKKAFYGGSQASLISSIMSSEPAPVSAIQPMTPVTLDRLVRRCLAKNPNARWQTAADLAEALNWVRDQGSSGTIPAPEVVPAKSRDRLPWTLTAVLAVIALVLTTLYFSPAPPNNAVARFNIETPTSTQGLDVMVSPDGRQVAYIAPGSDTAQTIWVRSLDQLEARELAGTEGPNELFWSPDSRFLGFQDTLEGKLMKVDVTGAPPQSLTDNLEAGVLGASWSPEGVIIFSANIGRGREIHRVSSAGGATALVTDADDGVGGAYPRFLPDGRHFLFHAGSGGVLSIRVGSLDSPESSLLVENGLMPIFVPGPDYLLFVRDSVLMAQPFDAGSLAVSGEPFPVVDQVATNPSTNVGYDVSGNGVLIYRGRLADPPRPTWFDRAGRPLDSADQAAGFNHFQASPARDRLAVSFEGDVWLVDLERGSNSRFTFDPAPDQYPVFSPDGTEIVFTSNRGGRALYRKAANSIGDEKLVAEGVIAATSWSPDGRYILYTNPPSEETNRDVMILDLSSGESTPFVQTPFDERHAAFSPDGKWIAYISLESGRFEVYVQPAPETGMSGKWQVSVDGGFMPRWRGDGRELFFTSLERTLMVSEVGGAATFDHDVPRAMFTANIVNPMDRYAVADNGERFLFRSLPASTGNPKLTVVLNWFEELKARAPAP